MTQDEINRQLIESMAELASVMSSLTGNTQTLNSTLAKNKKAFDDLHPAVQSEIESAKIKAIVSDNQTKAETAATASVVSLGKAFLSAEKGFSKYSAGLDSAGSALWNLSKNFGVVGMVAGALGAAATKAAALSLKQADNALKASDELAEMGSAGAFTAEEVRRMGRGMGLFSENLSVFTKAVSVAGKGVISLGATAGDGVKAFAELANVGDKTLNAFQRLGVSQEQLAENQAEYVRNLNASGVVITEQMKRDGSLKKASLEYTENLLLLSSLTGRSTKDLKEKLAIEQTQFQFRIKQSSLGLQAMDAEKLNTEEGRARAKMIRAQIDANVKALAAAEATGDAQEVLAIQSLIGTEAITKENAILVRRGMDTDKFIAGLKRGEDQTVYYTQQLVDSTGDLVRNMSDAVVYNQKSAEAYGLGGNKMAYAMSKAGVDIGEATKKAQANIGKPGDGKTGAKTEKDPAQIARNELTEAERKAKGALDDLLASVNPLLGGFKGVAFAATLLTAAALAASVALAGIAGVKALGGLFGGKGGPAGPGGGGGGAPSGGGPKPVGGMSTDQKTKYDTLRAQGMSASEAKRQAGGFGSLVQAEGKITGAAKPIVSAGTTAATTATSAASGASTAASTAAGGAKAGAGALSALGKFTGPLAGLVSVGTGIMTVADGLKNANTAQEKGGVIGKGTGQAAGGVGGAMIGGAIGTAIFPVVGTAIGAALGGWLGGKAGDIVGEKVGEVAGKAFEGPEAKNIQEKESKATKDLISSLDSLRISIDALRRVTATSTTLTSGTATSASKGNTTTSASQGNTVAGTRSIAPTSASGGSATPTPTPTVSPAKPTSQPPEGSGNDGAKKVEVAKILKFGTGSGSQQNFEGLTPTFKDAVTAAASEYNSVTGNKITINSAKRDSADQQRLYDESVAAGRPGRGPTGMAIGKPGHSLHEKGEAVDIQNYNDNLAVSAFNRQGLLQKVPNDPVHFQAMNGAMLNGPKSGYPVAGTMHGPEAIMPLKPDSIIAKLINTSEAQLKQEMTTNNNINSTSSNDNTSQIMEDLYAMMEEKFDTMINALEDGNNTADKLLKYSRV